MITNVLNSLTGSDISKLLEESPTFRNIVSNFLISQDLNRKIDDFIRGNQVIMAIKEYRAVTKCSLLEAKQIVEKRRDQLGLAPVKY